MVFTKRQYRLNKPMSKQYGSAAYYLVPYIDNDQKYFNALKSVLYVEKLVVGQVIIFNKTIISLKKVW